MSSFTRTLLPTLALAAMMSAAQSQAATAEPIAQDHAAHHSANAVTTPVQPGMPANATMMGQGMAAGMMGSGMMGPGMMGGMMPMMRPMMTGQPGAMGAMHDGMGMPFEHIEGRIAFLKAEIGITDAQQPQWNAFAEALRSAAGTHQAMHDQMMGSDGPTAWPDRLALREQFMSSRLDAVKALRGAAQPLYAVLTEAQKATADQLLSGPMGMM